jgi:hypothetical protein
MKNLMLMFSLLFATLAAAQTEYVTQTVVGNQITFKNVSGKTIKDMGGDLLEAGEVVGLFEHTFTMHGFKPGAKETMSLTEQSAPSVVFRYIYFTDGTYWKAVVVAPASATSGQTLNIDLANSYCKKNTFTPGYTLHGTWRNAVTGCAAYGSVEKQSPYACASDPNYGYPDLAYKSCKTGICCTIQYTALRPTVAADTDCLAPSNGFYTGVFGEQQ